MNQSRSVHKLLQGSDQRIGAVVLAGGLARRMGGQDKGLISLAGKPMFQYALATVSGMVDQCVVNANRNAEQYEVLALPFGASVIPDTLEGHLGPLAGLSAAIDSLDTDFIVMCPCDSPFLQAELISTLLQSCLHEDADIAVANDGERLQPVFCVVNRRIKSSLDAFLHSGQRKIDRWFDECKVVKVPAECYAESFRNINTEQERLVAELELQDD